MCHLYSIERNKNQLLDDVYAACFTTMPVTKDDPNYMNSLICLCQKNENDAKYRLLIKEIGTPKAG